ncbi:MAG: DUF4276 family protein [Thermoanaerobaculia bacterium]
MPAERPPAGQSDLDVVFLVVEGENDRRFVTALLDAAGYPLDRVDLVVGHGKSGTARAVSDLADQAPGRCAVLIDLDELNVPDARARARAQLGDPPAEVFCAVPSLEAWLFADDRALLANARSAEEVQRIVRRLPLPEEIPDPKQLARQVFGPESRWEFLRQIDIGRAAARSPSLRAFLEGMARLLGVDPQPLGQGVARNISRDIIAGLIREVSPSDAVVWRTTDGEEYTASQLQRHIEEGDEVGRQYSSDLLRISRDFLRRAANRPKPA